MLALGIRYLTGYAVATDPSDRTRAEWPPHPGRVFMALADAYFETGEDVRERQALEWLEAPPSPLVTASDADARRVVTHYVPVNDRSIAGKAFLQSAPAIARIKQPQHLPARPSGGRHRLVHLAGCGSARGGSRCPGIALPQGRSRRAFVLAGAGLGHAGDPRHCTTLDPGG